MNKKLKNRIKMLAVTAVVVAQVLFFSSSLIGSLNAETIDVSPVGVEATTVIDSTQTKSPENLSVEEATESELIEAVVVPVVEPEVVVEPITENSIVSETAANTVTVAPELSTDKDDYHPGETATIFGKFFDPLQNIILKIFGSDDNDQNYTESFQSITTDSVGSFSTQYQLDNLYRPFYLMTASDLNGTLLAQGMFRDTAIGTYDQCSNDDGDGYATGDQGCRWVNGNLQSNNSVYFEHDATVQRLWLRGFVPGTTHTVTLKYGTTKGGKHAYDFLTEWNHSEIWITEADRCQDVAGCVGHSEGTFPIPSDPNAASYETPGRVFTMRGGSVVGATTPSVFSGSYAGDSETIITLTFNVDSSGSMCFTKQGVTSCDVALWFGAHVSSQDDWGLGNSAVNISGSPYHVALDSVDGEAVGQRDNQMASAAVVSNASITIIKDAVPNDGQDFAFTTTGTGLSGFSLDDDADGTLSNTQTFSGLAAGNYTVDESAVSGWSLTGLTCVDPTSNTTVDVGTGVASINLAAGESVTCTYTNSLQTGHIIVVKDAVPNDAQNFTFTNNFGNGNPATFDLDDDADGTLSNSRNSEVLAGTYAVSEGAVTGWTQTSATCSDGSPVGAVVVSPGETVTCTFTNTKQPTLTLVKTVVNDNGGAAVAHDFQGKIDGGNVPWSVAQVVSVGAHTASEAVVSNYTASVWGGDCAANGSVTLAAGENKTCTITNDDQAAHLIIIKEVINDNGGTKTAGDFGGNISGVTAEGGNTWTGTVAPGVDKTLSTVGAYNVTENADADYTTTYSADCTGTIALGETKTCTVTNNDIAPILHLRKVVVNDNGGTATTANFTLTANGTGANDISGTSPVDSGAGLDADTFALSETNVAGYTASDWVCVGGTQNGANITLGLGDEATCTITNDDQQAYITVIKAVINDNGGTKTVADFALNLEGNPVTSGVAVPVNPGTYTAGETFLAGYSFIGFTGDCDGSGDVTVALGESKTCTLTNDDQSGNLIVHKITVPANDPTVFSVTLDATPVSGSATRDLSTAGVVNYEVNAGTYSVSEATEAGWDETSNTCEDVVIANGEAKHCYITNTQRGHVIIVKDVIGNPDPTDFTFQNNFGNGNPATFMLDEDTNGTLPSFRDFEVLPGTYSVSEDPIAGWQLESATCDNGETIGSIDVAPGETVTCTFVNEELVSITLIKNTIGGDDTFDFDGTGEGLPTDIDLTTVAGTATQTFEGLDQDNTFSITENTPAGWAMTSAVCTGDETPGNITPEPGEDVTCTFTNNKPAAQIDLTPLTATNKVGDNHVISANVQVHNGDGAWGPAVDGTVVTFSITNSNGATATFVGGNTCATTGGACSITINSPTAGSVAVHATVSPVVLGVSVAVATDGLGDNSADAGKDYVNARISITPNQDTNEVSDDHDFVVKVEQSVADGVWTPVPAGTLANAIVSPATSLDVSDCNDGVNASGECTVTINSSAAGIFTITARSTVNVGGVEFKLQTNGVGENSEPAVKTYVDAKISINPPSAVNEVGDAHVLTANVMEDDGAGFDPAVGETVTFTVTSGSATFVGGVNTCVTNGSGECTVSIESNDVGDNTIKAVSDVGVASLVLHRETDSTHGSTGPAVKKYVDAYITIGDTATNNITEEHVFTVTVTQVPGTVTPALTADVTPSVLPAPDSYSTTCDSSVDFVGNVATCTITINNNTPGVFTATASASVTIGGASLTRSTDGTAPNSGSAIKTYVAGSLQVTKVVDFGSVVNPTAINDTFTVTVTGPSYPGGHDIVFTVLNGVLQAPTSVTLDPIIPGDYTITEADAGTEWTETVPAGAVTVVASQTAQVEVTNTYVPGSLEISKVVNLNGYLLPDGVDLDFTVNVTGPSYPAPHAVVFNVVNGVVTNSPQTLNNLIPGAYTVTEVDPGIAWTVSGNGNVDVVSAQTATKTITNDLKTPHTTITLTPDVFETLPGGNVILTITDTNDGQVPISNPSVELFANGVLTVPQPTYVSGDTNTNGIMDVGETWTWTVSVTINVETVFVVNGIGTDPLGNPVNGPTYSTETASQTVKVVGATRTIGFWQTHTGFTSYVFGLPSMQNYVGFNGTSSASTHKGIITNTQSTGQSQLFGAFYAPIAKTTTGAKRTPVDQARIQMLQQLVAAKLNCAAFGCSAATLQLIADADAAYLAGANKNTIIALAGQLDAYNNSGDDIAIDPLLPPTGKATPKTSQGYANLGFWNTP